MKKLVYIALAATLLSTFASCSNKLCPAYGSYPRRGR
jgi:hypothetical protein